MDGALLFCFRTRQHEKSTNMDYSEHTGYPNSCNQCPDDGSYTDFKQFFIKKGESCHPVYDIRRTDIMLGTKAACKSEVNLIFLNP